MVATEIDSLISNKQDDHIICHLNQDIFERKGGTINNYTGTTGVDWNCLTQIECVVSLHITAIGSSRLRSGPQLGVWPKYNSLIASSGRTQVVKNAFFSFFLNKELKHNYTELLKFTNLRFIK